MRVPGGGHDVRDLQDTLQSLLHHLAAVEDQAVATILNIVQVFVGAMKDKMAPDKIIEEPAPQKESNEEGLILRIITELEAERKAREKEAEELLKCPEDGFHDRDSTKQEIEEEEEEEEVKETVSQEQEWLRTVVNSLLHFLSMSGRPDWQRSALTSVTTGLQLLASTAGQAAGERQTVLLPLVHKVWQPLKLCFKSPNIFLVDTVSFSALVSVFVIPDV